jgi:hypothetical protein
MMKDEELRKRLAESGQAAVRKTHDLNVVAKKLIEVLDAD